MTLDPPSKSDSTDAQDHGPLRQEPVVIPSPGMHEKQAAPAMPPRRRGKKVKGVVMKIIRRTHLYTGLILLPWVLMMGFTGFLMNHSDLLRPTPEQTVTAIAPQQSQQFLGMAAIDPSLIAQQIVAQLNKTDQPDNAAAKTGSYELVNPSSAHLRGQISLQGKSQSQNHTFTLNVQTGQGELVSKDIPPPDDNPRQTLPPFADRTIEIESMPVNEMADQMTKLAASQGIESKGNWTLSKNGPEVRFQLKDQDARVWNVTYNLLQGQLAARAEDELPVTDVATIMTTLHKQHNYPTEWSMRVLWLIFVDATGLTMVFWGLSGAIMWWQLKPTRTIGIAALLIMAAVAYFIISGTLQEIYFSAPRGRAAATVKLQPRPATSFIPLETRTPELLANSQGPTE